MGNLPTPSSTSEPATKGYVDGFAKIIQKSNGKELVAICAYKGKSTTSIDFSDYLSSLLYGFCTYNESSNYNNSLYCTVSGTEMTFYRYGGISVEAFVLAVGIKK